MIYPALVVLGLCLGSFVNALVWRLHEQATFRNDDGKIKKLSSRDKARFEKLSIAKGRSMCSRCGHQLSTLDLIPVLSWLALRGKCRYCHEPIPDTPVAELVVPLLLVVSYHYWPYITGNWDAVGVAVFGVWVLILTCFVALALYDARWFLLPDRIVRPLTVFAIAFVLLRGVELGRFDVLLWSVLGAVTLSGTFLLLSLVSKGSWIGWGDVKLAISLGLLAGSPLMSLLVIFIASILGTVVALPRLTRAGGLKSSLPFGPHLILGTVIVVLFGQSLIDWYFALLTA